VLTFDIKVKNVTLVFSVALKIKNKNIKDYRIITIIGDNITSSPLINHNTCDIWLENIMNTNRKYIFLNVKNFKRTVSLTVNQYSYRILNTTVFWSFLLN
jgi:hypothetical protein